jgi:hypothetical protein
MSVGVKGILRLSVRTRGIKAARLNPTSLSVISLGTGKIKSHNMIVDVVDASALEVIVVSLNILMPTTIFQNPGRTASTGRNGRVITRECYHPTISKTRRVEAPM